MDVYAALADPVRRSLLRAVVAGPARVVDLAAEQAISRPAVSRHLRLLGEAGLVQAQTRGRERRYRLTPSGLDPVRQLLGELEGSGPRFTEQHLAALDLEVRRTVREHPTPSQHLDHEQAHGDHNRQRARES